MIHPLISTQPDHSPVTHTHMHLHTCMQTLNPSAAPNLFWDLPERSTGRLPAASPPPLTVLLSLSHRVWQGHGGHQMTDAVPPAFKQTWPVTLVPTGANRKTHSSQGVSRQWKNNTFVKSSSPKGNGAQEFIWIPFKPPLLQENATTEIYRW